MSDRLKVTVREDEGAFVIALAGDEISPIEIDAMRHAVEQVIGGSPVKPVVMDLTELRYLSSEAVGLIAATHRDLAAQDRRMTVRNPTAQVARVFTVTRLDRFLNIEYRTPEGGAGG